MNQNKKKIWDTSDELPVSGIFPGEFSIVELPRISPEEFPIVELPEIFPGEFPIVKLPGIRTSLAPRDDVVFQNVTKTIPFIRRDGRRCTSLTVVASHGITIPNT